MRQGAFQVVSRVLARPVRRRRRRVARLAMVVAAGVVAGAGVAGCSQPTESMPTVEVSEDARPPAEPSPSPTPEQTPEPVTEPVPPPEMERGDEAGAIAAAEYFVRLYAYAYATGDLSTWDAISGQTCEFCQSVRSDVAAAYGQGHRFTGGELEAITGARVTGVDPQIGYFTVEIGYRLGAGTEANAAGEEVSTFPVEEGTILYDVIPSTRGWVMIEAMPPDASDAS